MVASLEDHLGYWLRFVSNYVSQRFGERLAERGIGIGEWVLLRLLHDGPAAPSTLAARTGMTRGAISKLADRLESRALAKRTPDRQDRRYQAISLTPQGRALVPKLAALADENDAHFFQHLTPAERERITTALREIVRRHGLRSLPVA
jgi:DNA-binding MarR family transcriptional regulator